MRSSVFCFCLEFSERHGVLVLWHPILLAGLEIATYAITTATTGFREVEWISWEHCTSFEFGYAPTFYVSSITIYSAGIPVDWLYTQPTSLSHHAPTSKYWPKTSAPPGLVSNSALLAHLSCRNSQIITAFSFGVLSSSIFRSWLKLFTRCCLQLCRCTPCFVFRDRTFTLNELG